MRIEWLVIPAFLLTAVVAAATYAYLIYLVVTAVVAVVRFLRRRIEPDPARGFEVLPPGASSSADWGERAEAGQ